MSAVCYLVTADGQYLSHLLKAKSKLALLKTLTIPNLELCAALLLANLMKSVLDTCVLTFQSINLFTDSRIVIIRCIS